MADKRVIVYTNYQNFEILSDYSVQKFPPSQKKKHMQIIFSNFKFKI